MRVFNYLLAFAFVLMAACSTSNTVTQSAAESPRHVEAQRVIPYPVEEPMDFLYAVEQGTRTLEGKPGPNYFTNTADYIINARLLPADTLLYGEATITYHNNSPDTLQLLVFELAQNLHKAGMPRNEVVEITGGVHLSRVAVEGQELGEVQFFQPGYAVETTNLIVIPHQAVGPNESVTVEIDWNFKVPQAGASGRMGYSQDNLYFLAYWYPHVATYDDIEGWFADVFTANAEFYHGFGNYELNITVPDNWIVMSTGHFENAEEVLADEVHRRFMHAQQSDTTFRILDAESAASATKPSQNGTHTWKFRAENIRDVAFSATAASNWDALKTPVGDIDGDGEEDYATIHALWRNNAPLWKDAAEYTAHAISYLSEYTGYPYPWSHMTAVEGADIIGGGMEFPMITLIGSYNRANTEALYDVIAHEIAHMWIPMVVSNNERRNAWLDEGATTFHEANARWDIFPESFSRTAEFQPYLRFAGTPYEGEIMRWSDYHYPGPAYGVASYPKPGTVLIALQGVLGEELFMQGWREFINRWAYKHPTPYDLFNTFEDVVGKDLDWFWRSWYFETWVLDQAVEDVQQNGNLATITISDLGQVPMPVDLTITLADGNTVKKRIEVDDWLAGNIQTSITIEAASEVIRVVIDADEYYPDADRSNNIWVK